MCKSRIIELHIVYCFYGIIGLLDIYTFMSILPDCQLSVPVSQPLFKVFFIVKSDDCVRGVRVQYLPSSEIHLSCLQINHFHKPDINILF